MAGGSGDHHCYIGFEQQATDAGYGSSLQYLEELGKLRRFVDQSFSIESGGLTPNDSIAYRQTEARIAGELAMLLGVTLEDVIA